MENEKHWRSKAQYVEAYNFKELCDKLTEFAKDKFVIAWQVFTNGNLCPLHAIVTYKVQED